MVIKWGRFGQFLSCSAYPDCKNAKPVPSGVKCPQEHCGGDLIERRARGRHFYGCSNYPNCRYTTRRLEKDAAGVDRPAAETSGESSSEDEGDQRA
jgi:DNA topoisomerase-1